MVSRARDLTNARWVRSSYSNASGGNCVEVAQGSHGVVPVRDSKRAAEVSPGPVLLFGTAPWAAFLAALKH